jgi:hypothetical protein
MFDRLLNVLVQELFAMPLRIVRCGNNISGWSRFVVPFTA